MKLTDNFSASTLDKLKRLKEIGGLRKLKVLKKLGSKRVKRVNPVSFWAAGIENQFCEEDVVEIPSFPIRC
jgi:hypothetical protein